MRPAGWPWPTAVMSKDGPGPVSVRANTFGGVEVVCVGVNATGGGGALVKEE